MTISVLEQIRELDERKAMIIDAARDQAMTEAMTAIDVLNKLGGEYELALKTYKKNKAKPVTSKRRTTQNRPCPVCEFKTDPPHDPRQHKAQGNTKRPFIESELQERQLTVV